jgi:two-component system, chemotaxis family, protein-glutamate methylesterase/glutaminase
MKQAAEFEAAKRTPVRVLVADPSAVVRTAVKRMLESDEGVQVIGTAQDGQEAVEKTRTLRPDVVALDIHMNRHRGVEVLREITQRCARPVVMLSEASSAAAEETLQALDEGAFDYAPKQVCGDPREMARQRYELVSKVKAAARAARQRANGAIVAAWPRPEQAGASIVPIVPRVICIGSSTGGPRALQQLLPHLPANLPASVLLVQHMPEGFTGPFARRLDSLCAMEVREARSEDHIEPGVVLIAPSGWHMAVYERQSSSAAVRLSKTPDNLLHRPSVDVLMSSAAATFRDACMGIILTGMGADGARGMKAIYEAGGITLGQDEASCAVYGMPRSCAELGVLQRTVPLSDMRREILLATRYEGGEKDCVAAGKAGPAAGKELR